MHPLTHRPCVGRRVARSLDHFVRFASNTPSPNPPPAQVASNEPTPDNPHIARTWNNIVIPTREEILKRPRKIVPGHDRGKLYKPDLSYLQKGSPTSFASRLAAEATASTPLSTNPAPAASASPSRLTKAEKQQIKEREQQIKERERRVAEATAQRKAERLAREEAHKAQAQAVPPKPRQRANHVPRQTDTYEGVDSAMQKVERRGTQSTQHRQQSSRGGAASRGARGGMRSSNPRGDARQSSVPAVAQTPRTQTAEAVSSEDITLEILETGGDDKAPAEFRTPDVPFTNLDDVFGSSPEKLLEEAISATSASTEAQVQWLREIHGGDYLRFASQTSVDFVTPHRKLGPLKHAQLVLAKRRDVSAGARKDALAIITSALGDAGAKAVQKA
ncbi:hypothetical protein FPV67DRAFT_1466917 [Lyophyllum atratum]|nr:hypothetical protein FPV67DRAFT_1466917 [Lyophyllum atratum]